MTKHMRWLCLASLVLLPLVWLWPSVVGGRTLVPFDAAQFPPASLQLDDDELAAARQGSDFDVTEVVPWLLPEMRLARSELQSWRWPSWNPHARTGSLMHEIAANGLLYPPHWLCYFGPWDPQDVLPWLAWLSFALAGVFTFGLLRACDLGAPAAWFGGACFELSGTMATNGYYWMRVPPLVWLPALLWAVLLVAKAPQLTARLLAAFAAAFALPWLAGFPPYASATSILAGLLAARLLLERLGREGAATARVLVRRFVVTFGTGLLCTMPQLLPSLWFFSGQGARTAGASLANANGAMFEKYGLLGYLTPDAFGHPIDAPDLPYAQNPLCYLWGGITDANGHAAASNYNYTEYTVFAGAATLVLALYGARRGQRHLHGFAVLTLALLIAIAMQVPGIRLLSQLPGFANVAPMRWLAPATLFVCWLGAIGFDHLQHVARATRMRLALFAAATGGLLAWLGSLPRAWHAADPVWPARPIADRFGLPTAKVQELFHPTGGTDWFDRAAEQIAHACQGAAWWFAGTALVLVAHALWGNGRPRLRLGLALALAISAIAQLALHGAPLLAGHTLTHSTDTPVHAFLRERAQALRDGGGFTIARASRLPTLPAQLPPGQLMDPGIRDLQFLTFYDARSLEPLRTLLGTEWSARHAARGYLEATLPDTVLAHPLLDLYGVRYVLATEPLQFAGTRVGPEMRRRVEFYVYERPHALPRAFTVPTLRVLPHDADVLAAMTDPDARFAVVAFATAEDAPPVAPAPTADTAPARAVRFVRDDPTCIELDVAAGQAPWLVLTDTWLPGWTATIDGETATVHRCNHCQRLLGLPTTACRVRFEHHPPWLATGLLLAAFGGAVLAMFWLVGRRAPTAASRG